MLTNELVEVAPEALIGTTKPSTTKVKLLDDNAVMPTRAHESDTGYDLTFIGYTKIVSDTIYFRTGISLSPPSGYYFEVVPRSSISGLPLMMANSVGVIDEHYRGEILVPVKVMHNNMGLGFEKTHMPSGVVNIFGLKPSTMTEVANQILIHKPKLFQLILRKKEDTTFVQVDNLEQTERGNGGFGSTDVMGVSRSKKKP